jgi:hypothetical protein
MSLDLVERKSYLTLVVNGYHNVPVTSLPPQYSFDRLVGPRAGLDAAWNKITCSFMHFYC